MAGLNGRGSAILRAAALYPKDTTVMSLCDVDKRTFEKVINRYPNLNRHDLSTYVDIRKMLEDKKLDAIAIAAPDHWHAPMAIMAMNAGKHVFLEKPFAYNPQEGEWIIEVEKKTGMVLQIGNQQRSAPTSIEVINDIHNGLIGNAYYAKAWYSNNRESIGKGQKTVIPKWLDWDLWQGPAPRVDYKDNIVHYNWHWLRHWGTGEICNNGLHELDIARWALGVDLPNKVNSTGGRFHFPEDDWEYYDTQLASYEYSEGKSINWEGRSCRRYPEFNGMSRGNAIYGTKGSVIMGRQGYKVFDNDNNIIQEATEKQKAESGDIRGKGGLDGYHFRNFLDGIQRGTKLRSTATEAQKSTLMCHLGNMAQKHGGALDIDVETGRPNNEAAMEMWSRDYEDGWKPVL